MPDFIHQSYGRVRIKLENLKFENTKLEAIQAKLENIIGVERIKIRSRTGSVTIIFNPDNIGPDVIIKNIQKLGYLTNIRVLKNNFHSYQRSSHIINMILKKSQENPIFFEISSLLAKTIIEKTIGNKSMAIVLEILKKTHL